MKLPDGPAIIACSCLGALLVLYVAAKSMGY